MKKSLLLAVVFWQIFGPTTAQTPCATVAYYCTTQLRSGQVFDGSCSLHFNQSQGLFVHNDYAKESRYIENGNMIGFIKGDPEGLPVFMDLAAGHLHYKLDYGAPPEGENFILQEALPTINWQMLNDTAIIGGFTSYHAVGEFGGRVYDAWFTPEIPVSLGPYKLHGLPGMILEATSKDGKVGYSFVGYEPDCERAIEKPSKGIEITLEELQAVIIRQLLRSESSGHPGDTDDNPPADWEIERSKFNFINEYKAERGRKRDRP